MKRVLGSLYRRAWNRQTLTAYACLAILISLLQGSLSALAGFGKPLGQAGLVLAAGNLTAGFGLIRSRKAALGAVVLALLLAQAFVFVAADADSHNHRFLRAGLVSGFFATGLLAGASLLVSSGANAALLAVSVAGSFFAAEAFLESKPAAPDPAPRPKWEGSVVPHPVIGAAYRPYSVHRTLYPDNPRGYFDESDLRVLRTSLHVEGDNEAKVVFPKDRPDVERIEISRAGTRALYDIQLNYPYFRVEANQRYSVRFRARAEDPRTIHVGFAMAHEPWNGLGYYRAFQLDAQWRSFKDEFTAEAADDNARIHFDAGGAGISLEFSGVELRKEPSGDLVQPGVPPKQYFISYRTNALGCRGPDYPIPKPAGTVRVLVLGDSYAEGVGVREEHTFAAVLQDLLNRENRSRQRYEVINCGVSGYSTEQERLAYEVKDNQYHPDLVLLTMVFNDDLSYKEEVERGYADRPRTRLEFLSKAATVVQEKMHTRVYDYSKLPGEVLKLNQSARKTGARLALILFRNDCDFAGEGPYGQLWNRLSETMNQGLRGSGIPVLDLGRPFCAKHSFNEMVVHSGDHHPNEMAHRIAAGEILDLLRKEKLL